ncbi:MAG: agarase [Planctomycetota bacterium]
MRLIYSTFCILTSLCFCCDTSGIEDHEKKEHTTLEVLYSFDDSKVPQGFEINNGKASFVNEADSNSLRVQLNSKDEQFAGLAIKPAKPWNWAEYSDFSLAFDIGNQGEVSTHVYLGITDSKGGSYSRSVSVPVGKKRTFYAKLDGHDLNLGKPTEGIKFGHNFASGLRSNPATWGDYDDTIFVNMWGKKNLQLSSISKITLNVQNTIRDKEFTIDNIRLVANPAMDEQFLSSVVDKFGQNAKVDFLGKVHDEGELIKLRDAELKQLNDGTPLGDRTRFSGWKNGPKLEATGYFRTEKVGDKWAMVTPDGYLYFSTGLDIIRLANSTTFTGYDFDQKHIKQREPGDLTPEDSLGLMTAPPAAWPTRHLTSQTRADMFEWLPKYEDKLGKHFGYRRQAHSGAMPRGETYSFYSANLERRYGDMGDHEAVWRKVTVDRMLNWGFTSFGNWVDPAYYQNERIPYFANGWIIGHFKKVSGGGNFWHPMPDVFDPLFAERADATAKQIAAEVQGSPWCVGVFIDNEKSWGRNGSDSSRLGIVINTLTRDGQECPLKAEFTRLMKKKYVDIAKLNSAWNKNIESWQAFEKGIDSKLTNATCKADYSDLLKAYADRYFKIVSESLEKYMPNHMYFGCRFTHWGMPREALEAACNYVDVIGYNSYVEGLQKSKWAYLEEIDKPFLIGEFHFGATSDTGLFHPGLVHASDQEDRARAYTEYVHSVIDNPYFVGCHWFQYMDSPITGRALDGENYNVGFVRVTDVPYASMVNAAKKLHGELYERRFGELKKEK